MTEFDCPLCQKTIQFIPRDKVWTGGRANLRCPHCRFEFRSTSQFPQGARILGEPTVELVNFQNETTIFLEEFQTSINDAREFAVRFREVWEAIPTKCRHAVATHWSGPGGAPHVWLLRDPKEWNGKGWAASLPDGRSLFFAASVIPAIPPEHLKVFIAHELGHILWIASMEPTHLEWPQNAESMCRCEWLVWQLMKAWGYDQIEAEVWVERHFEKGNSEWVLRGTPLEEAACRAGLADGHRKLERSVTDKSLPNCYYEWQLS